MSGHRLKLIINLRLELEGVSGTIPRKRCEDTEDTDLRCTGIMRGRIYFLESSQVALMRVYNLQQVHL